VVSRRDDGPFIPTRELASRLRRTIIGPMWHGPSVDEVLERFTADSALARPIASAHTAWELVLHMTAWARFGVARLSGQSSYELSDEQDFPATPAIAADAQWTADCDALRAAYAELSDIVRALPVDELLAPMENRDYNAVTMLNGIVEHATYHGGQLVLLHKALGR
jgi:uncharacterized damage-inducible protein DinB